MPIDYIVNKSISPAYPSWIKNHDIFNKYDKIEKIFPHIGLNNFKEEQEISTITESTVFAREFCNAVIAHISGRINGLWTYLESYTDNSRERNEKCNKVAQLILIFQSLNRMPGQFIYDNVDQKIVIKIARDIFNGASSNPIFKKGQPLFRCLATIDEILTEVGLTKTGYETYESFKAFSINNSAVKKVKIVFSSDGPDGAWDIATASMRKITSCQRWDAPQSRGLIGSISSKYLGIIYAEVPGPSAYGTDMVYRSMVRLAIHKTTKTPILVVDRSYPNYQKNYTDIFNSILKKKTGLTVLDATNNLNDITNNYHVYEEKHKHLLKQGEASYMDCQLKSEPLSNSKLHKYHINGGCNFRDVQNTMSLALLANLKKRQAHYSTELYHKNAAARDPHSSSSFEPELLEEDIKDDKPTLVSDVLTKNIIEFKPSFGESGKGEQALINTYRFFHHCTNHGIIPGDSILKRIFIELDYHYSTIYSHGRMSEHQTYRTMYYHLFANKDKNKIIEPAWNVFNTGSYMKSFPKASKRFFDTVLVDIKQYLVLKIKETI